MKPVKALRITACLLGVALLTACAALEEEVGNCEPGVSEISDMETVTPAPGC